MWSGPRKTPGRSKGENMKKVIPIILFLIAGINAKGPAEYTKEFINVSGEASFKVDPTRAYIIMGVSDVNMNSDSALKKADKGSEGILNVCKKYKIDSSMIKTLECRLSSENEYDRVTNANKFVGFRATIRYEIIMIKPAQIDSFIANCFNSGGNDMQGITFSNNNLDSLKRIAAEMAMQDALKNAQALLKNSNRKVGRILNASFEKPENFDLRPSVGYPEDLEPRFVKGGAISRSGENKQMFFRVMPGKIEVQSRVYVVYEIR
jgi:uncharacterized protein YggE